VASQRTWSVGTYAGGKYMCMGFALPPLSIRTASDLATASQPRAVPTRMASTSACAISIAGGINA
jgi:hypothetical protein